MADEYVVRIVLDGVDNASDDIEKVGNELDELGTKTSGVNFDLAMFTGGMALTVGALNQFTGGLRKSHGAAERLGFGTQENRDKLAHYLDVIELIVGPFESLISLFVLAGAGVAIFGSTAFATGAATLGLTAAATALGIPLAALIGLVLGVTLAIVGLGVALVYYKDEVNDYLRQLYEVTNQAERLDRALIRVKEGIEGVANAISSSGGNLVENFDNKLRNGIAGAGGSITRLAGPVQ